jgi:hypothetical protein
MHTSNTSFYTYNGELSALSGDILPPANELWQFTPSGDSGMWSYSGVLAGANLLGSQICVMKCSV